MLGLNLVILGYIFDCILPFSFLFHGEILVLANSPFRGANFCTSVSQIGGIWC